MIKRWEEGYAGKILSSSSTKLLTENTFSFVSQKYLATKKGRINILLNKAKRKKIF